MEKIKFFIWRASYEEGFCVLQSPEGIEKAYQLNRGIARAEGWPSDVVCRMDPEYPKDIQLADNLYGTLYIVISNRIKQLLLSEIVSKVEFLPVSIRNHKGRIASKDYFIMNPLDVVSCIDLDKSFVRWNHIKNDLINSCNQLVLNEDIIPESCKVFRPKFLPTEILISDELVEKLKNANFTGLNFVNPLEFTGV